MMSSFVDMGDTDSDFNGDDEEGRERVRSGKSVKIIFLVLKRFNYPRHIV